MGRRIVHGIHHTHWDTLWYFSYEDAEIAFSYNMEQLLRYFRDGRVEHFHLDGQTAALDVYLGDHPERLDEVCELVTSGALTIGPFDTQLDCFSSNGESVINNLRLGMRLADRLGGSSKVAYLPDPFGHSADFPMIFNQLGIHDFVVTRGVGGPYGLQNEFRWQGADGSEVLVATLLAGYGYGTYAFREGTLLQDAAEDYNRLPVSALIERLVANSSINDEFVLPLGFDQNPAIPDLRDRVEQYNAAQDDYEFTLTTWQEFFDRLRRDQVPLQTFRGELTSTQYHRMHRSIFSARPDIKTAQDRAERELALRTQPLMVFADAAGIPFERGLVDRLWKKLTRAQTHSSATMVDAPNAQVLQRSIEVLDTASNLTVYLCRRLVSSMPDTPEGAILVASTLPYARSEVVELDVYTRGEAFEMLNGDDVLDIEVVDRVHESNAVRRRDPADEDPAGAYVRTRVRTRVDLDGLAYRMLTVREREDAPMRQVEARQQATIENERFRVALVDGVLRLEDLQDGTVLDDFVVVEDTGDEGDNYDYSYPAEDWRLDLDWADATCTTQIGTFAESLTVRAALAVPIDLEARVARRTNARVDVDLTIELRRGDDLVRLTGGITNHATSHRVRLRIATGEAHTASIAGTQFGVVERTATPPELERWREEGWFEEPSPQYPLLNHVSTVGERGTTTCFTRSVKEYELVGDAHDEIALVVLRAVGHMGLPDLQRRPGRPSGLDYKIMPSPDSQLLGQRVDVDVAIGRTSVFDANATFVRYGTYAADPVTYTHQSFDKAAVPILYFPVNPEDVPVPTSLTLGQFDGPVPYSTLTKHDGDEDYALRLFNASAEPFEVASSIPDQGYEQCLTDLREQAIAEPSSTVRVEPHRIATIRLQRRSTS